MPFFFSKKSNFYCGYIKIPTNQRLRHCCNSLIMNILQTEVANFALVGIIAYTSNFIILSHLVLKEKFRCSVLQ